MLVLVAVGADLAALVPLMLLATSILLVVHSVELRLEVDLGEVALMVHLVVVLIQVRPHSCHYHLRQARRSLDRIPAPSAHHSVSSVLVW